MIRFYGYEKCSTCRTAKRFLHSLGKTFEEINITTQPPSRRLLSRVLASGQYTIKDLLNRSGEVYRSMKLREKIPAMSQTQLLALLASHGRLIKRPIITDGTRATVGFDEARLRQVWGA